jgi:hypothetical protein
MDQIEIVIHNLDDTNPIKKEKDNIVKKVKDLKLTYYEFNLWFNKIILPRYTQDLKYFEK